MMKPPTKRLTPANTSRNWVTKPKPSSNCFLISAFSAVPVTACAPAGRAAVIRSRNWSWLTPGAAVTANVCTVPSGAKVSAAVCGSTNIKVAPASPAPNETSPTTVTVCGMLPISALVCAPTDRPDRFKVVDSTATSDLFCGPRPFTSLITGSSSWKANPNVGAPPLRTAVPSLPTSTAVPWMSGMARLTPSTALSLSARASGSGARSAVPSKDSVSLATPRTWTSVPTEPWSTIESNVLLRLSVRT